MTLLTRLLLLSLLTSIAACSSGGGGGASPGSTTPGNTTPATGSWTITTVDSAAGPLFGVGMGTSMALDSGGKAHISYYNADGSPDLLKYATNASGSWVIQPVDASIGDITDWWYERTRIAVDTSGKAKIAYTSLDTTTLGYLTEYATNQSGAWISTKPDLVSTGQGYQSIALDASGNPHLGYYTAYDMYVLSNTGGGWSQSIVEGVGINEGTANAIAVRGAAVHLVYEIGGFVSAGLRYAENSGGTWALTNIVADTEGKTLKGANALVLDSNGKAHVSYRADNSLYYATNASGSWVSTPIDSTTLDGQTSIALDSAGKVHISYKKNDALMYATNASGSWASSTVDNTLVIVGTYAAIGIDSSDKPHIAYYAAENGVGYLKYAVKQ